MWVFTDSPVIKLVISEHIWEFLAAQCHNSQYWRPSDQRGNRPGPGPPTLVRTGRLISYITTGDLQPNIETLSGSRYLSLTNSGYVSTVMTNIQSISGRIQASHNLPTWGILNIHFVTILTSGVRSPRHMSTGLPADWVDFWIFWFWIWLLDINTWLCDGRLYQYQPAGSAETELKCWECGSQDRLAGKVVPNNITPTGIVFIIVTSHSIVRGQESHISTTFPGLVTTELLIYW